jgi:hypothetical protein
MKLINDINNNNNNEIIINNNNNNNNDDPNVKKHKDISERLLNEKYSKKSTSFVLKRFDIQRIYDIHKGTTKVKDAYITCSAITTINRTSIS